MCGRSASRGQRPGPLQSRIRDCTKWRSRPSGGVLLTYCLLLSQHVVIQGQEMADGVKLAHEKLTVPDVSSDMLMAH